MEREKKKKGEESDSFSAAITERGGRSSDDIDWFTTTISQPQGSLGFSIYVSDERGIENGMRSFQECGIERTPSLHTIARPGPCVCNAFEGKSTTSKLLSPSLDSYSHSPFVLLWFLPFRVPNLVPGSVPFLVQTHISVPNHLPSRTRTQKVDRDVPRTHISPL